MPASELMKIHFITKTSKVGVILAFLSEQHVEQLGFEQVKVKHVATGPKKPPLTEVALHALSDTKPTTLQELKPKLEAQGRTMTGIGTALTSLLKRKLIARRGPATYIKLKPRKGET